MGHMYRLRRAYPRYSLKLGLVFVLAASGVCALCLHIIQSAKAVQLKYMKNAFCDCSSPLAEPDFDMENLDAYAATNLLAKMIDDKPRLVPKYKKVLLAKYVARMTDTSTGTANRLTTIKLKNAWNGLKFSLISIMITRCGYFKILFFEYILPPQIIISDFRLLSVVYQSFFA